MLCACDFRGNHLLSMHGFPSDRFEYAQVAIAELSRFWLGCFSTIASYATGRGFGYTDWLNQMATRSPMSAKLPRSLS